MADFIRFTCPNGHAMKAPEAAHGKRMRCAVCKAVALVPDDENTPLDQESKEREGKRSSPKATGQGKPVNSKKSNSAMFALLAATVLAAFGAGYWGIRNKTSVDDLKSEITKINSDLAGAADQAGALKRELTASQFREDKFYSELQDALKQIQLNKVLLSEAANQIQSFKEDVAKANEQKGVLETEIMIARKEIDLNKMAMKIKETLLTDAIKKIRSLEIALDEVRTVGSGTGSTSPTPILASVKKLIGAWQGPTTNMGGMLFTGFKLFYSDGRYSEALVIGDGAGAKIYKVDRGKIITFDGKKIVLSEGSPIVVHAFAETEMTIVAPDGMKDRFRRVSTNPESLFSKK